MKRLPFLALSCLLSACATASKSDQANDTRTPASSATVIRGDEISGSVLESMRTRIPTMRVATNVGPCPRIAFRGDLSARNQGNPSIYIDGTLMADTCALDAVSPHDIDFIEVYPSGNTPRATIRRNPFGLILIFRRQE